MFTWFTKFFKKKKVNKTVKSQHRMVPNRPPARPTPSLSKRRPHKRDTVKSYKPKSHTIHEPEEDFLSSAVDSISGGIVCDLMNDVELNFDDGGTPAEESKSSANSYDFDSGGSNDSSDSGGFDSDSDSD